MRTLATIAEFAAVVALVALLSGMLAYVLVFHVAPQQTSPAQSERP